VFGVRATTHLENRLADMLLGAWRDGGTVLRAPRSAHAVHSTNLRRGVPRGP
jgi:hypothetical protein